MQRWITDTEPSVRFPLYTRADAGEVLPDPVSPLAWSLVWEPGVVMGWTDTQVSVGTFDREDMDPVLPEVVGCFGGQQYLRLFVLDPPFVVDGTVPPLDEWPRRTTAAGAVAVGPGDVLVAPITDPSWTPLFVPAAAVVVEVGAQVSHAVIVSRELGIPCVGSVHNATSTIPDGAVVTVDGSSGTVTVIELPEG